MAKKLVRSYIFAPGISGEGFVSLFGVYTTNEILLITNSTDNQIIYNFAQPGLGGVCQYQEQDGRTVILLEADTSSMNESDSLQIFVDEEFAHTDFNDSFVDPVNKLRVSNPQNLIDTDFEYGLQPSKWETLELVNNIPAFYPSQSDISLSDVVSVASTADSDQIVVTTSSPHGLPVGTPIDVRGLDSRTAEGKYLIGRVPTETTFIYTARGTQQVTKVISGAYTIIVPGEFYTSSDVNFNETVGIVSDNGNPSTLTVQTDYVHGLAEDTNVYLTNTIASRVAQITQTTTSLAPDGRPYIDYENTTTNSLTIDSSLTETKEKKGIYSHKFGLSDVDISNDKILWPNNNLVPGDALLYVPPAGDTEIGGLQRFQIYYVKNSDTTGITLCETANGNYSGNPAINLTSTGTYNYGRAELVLCYEIKAAERVIDITTGQNCQQVCVIFSRGRCLRYETQCTPFSVYSTSAQTNLRTRASFDNTSDAGSGRDLRTFGNRASLNTGRTGNWGISNIDPERWVLAAKTSLTPLSTVWNGIIYSTGYNSNFTFAKSGTSPDGYDFVEDFSRFELGGTGTGANTSNRLSTASSGYFSLNNIGTGGYTGASAPQPGYSETYDSGVVFLVPLMDDPERDSLYIANHGLISGNRITVEVDTGSVIQLQDAATSITSTPSFTSLADPQTIDVTRVTSNRIRLRQNGSDARLRIADGTYLASFTGENLTRNSVYIENHGILSGENISISAGVGGILPTLSTNAPSPTRDGSVGGAVFAATELALTNIRSTMGADATTLYINGSSANQPFNGTAVTVGGGTIQLSHAFSSLEVRHENGQYIETVNLPSDSSWSQELPYDFMVNTAWGNVGYNVVQTKYQAQSEKNYWVTVIEFPDKANAGGSNIQITPNITASLGNPAFTAALTNNTNNTANWQSLSNGWRYTFDGAYHRPSNTANQQHGLFAITLILDNSTHPGYVSTYDQAITYSGIDPTITGYGGQRYLVMLLLPVKAGSDTAGTKYGTTSGSVASVSSIAQSIANSVVSNVVAATYTGASTVTKAVTINSNRFRLNSVGGVPLDFTDSGAANISFNLGTTIGALDGTHRISSANPYNFSIATPFSIPARILTLQAANISNIGNALFFNSPDHSLDFAQAIEFNDPGANFPALTNGATYYAIPADADYFAIATSAQNAIQNIPVATAAPTTGTYTFTIDSINGLIPGAGLVSITVGSKKVTGNADTLFKQYFKTGDRLSVVDNSTTPGAIRQLRISSVVSNRELNLTEESSFSATNTNYLVSTAIYVRPDGTFVHRPFDGGVEITAGKSPNSSIIRQTRKYFRYQSGKGIQCSIAINFNPARLTKSVEAEGQIVTVFTPFEHDLNAGDSVIIRGALQDAFNGTFSITEATDFSFKYEAIGELNTSIPSGIIEYAPTGWTNAAVRCGMFDEQNGFFYEYDGQQLYAVRRSSTQQLSGLASVQNGSNVVTGIDSSFLTQLNANDNIVIRGQSYKVTAVENASALHIQPTYRGTSQTNIVLTKTIDYKVPQSSWNLDTCDGEGESGFLLDITKIQMVYMDYSWYGAGKIRFGFKDNKGKVRYVHEFLHNNVLNEAYMRSGNLPARYQIENGQSPSYVPTLFHWGTSVIMDGRFDDDKAYLFTASSKSLSYTSGTPVSATTTAQSTLVSYESSVFRNRDYYVRVPFSTNDAGKFSTGTALYGGTLNGQTVAFTDYAGGAFNAYIYVATRRDTPPASSYPVVVSGTVVYIGSPAAGSSADLDLLKDVVPIVSIRLAPSVDNNLSGATGERDIINRMQLQLKQLGITSSHDCSIELILNGSLSTVSYETVQSPSLSQLIRHSKGDTIVGGTPVFSLRASGGQIDSAGKRLSNTIDFDLSQISDLGNSILGGDGVFPNGPDVLTIAARIVDTAEVTNAAPFRLAGRLTWTESQA